MTLPRHTTVTPRMEAMQPDDNWKDWFQIHGPKLLFCARQWTRTLADAEDVVQEAFVRFWRHQRHLAGDDPRALFITSIRRAALDLARSNARRTRREEVSAGEAEGLFVSGSDNADRIRIIEHALRRLPDEQREVLTLKIWGELTFDEIGRELNIPLNTAASRYRYALAALRSEMTIADCHG